MNISTELKIPAKNHRLRFKNETLSAYDAYKRVVDHDENLATAIKSEDSLSITLRFALIECPLCLSNYPVSEIMYAADITSYDEEDEDDDEEDDEINARYEKREKLNGKFYDWAMQLCIPEVINISKFDFIELSEDDTVICDHCGYIDLLTEDESEAYRLSIDSNEIRTIITQSTNHKAARKLLPYRAYETSGTPIPTEMSLIFDHYTGSTFFEESGGGRTVKKDITEHTTPLNGYKMRQYVNESLELKQLLISIFSDICNGNMPFCEVETTLETLIILNRFKGFPSRFYNAIPFKNGSRSLENSFTIPAAMLNNYQSIDAVYTQLDLPKKKALRKVIFERPELLFYTHEIRKLSCFNYDVLIEILNSQTIYGLLAYLRIYPELYTFLHQMLKESGSVYTWNYLQTNVERFVYEAGDYLRVIDGRQGEYTIKRWKKAHNDKKRHTDIGFNISVPNVSEIPDEQINAYYFVKLKSSEDYEKAAHDLKNCLRGFWRRPRKGVVFCMRIGSKYVAAIEVEKDSVLEATITDNDPIDTNEEIFAAFTHWMKKYNLKDKIGDMPF